MPLVALLEPHSLILGRSHYLLYSLALAMQPRWLLTLDETLFPISVTVRVGQAVDTVAKAGTPKTIAGIHTHNSPVLLGAGDRAELATEVCEQITPTLEGICILKKKEEVRGHLWLVLWFKRRLFCCRMKVVTVSRRFPFVL